MLIAILVLLGLAATIWYFARKQKQTTYSLTAEQTAELNRQIDRDAALAAAAQDSPSAPPSTEVEAAVVAEEAVVSTEAVKLPKKKRRYYPKKK